MLSNRICHKHHLNSQFFDSQEILDVCGLCFNQDCIKEFDSHSTIGRIICTQCLKYKSNSIHKQHLNEVINLDSVLRQLTRMILSPQKMAKDYLHRAAVALHKFQVIGEIREKIQKVEEEVEAEIIAFLDETQIVINQCSQIKGKISDLSQKLIYINDYDEVKETIQTIYKNLIINPEFIKEQQNGKMTQKQKQAFQLRQKCIKKAPSKLIHRDLPALSSVSITSENSQPKKWQSSLRTINECYQMFRDYAIKIVEICTVESSDDEEDDFQTNFAASARLYNKLQDEVKIKVLKDQSDNNHKIHSKTFEISKQNQYSISQQIPVSGCPKTKSYNQIQINDQKPKKLNISLQTQFSYNSDEFESPSLMQKKEHKHKLQIISSINSSKTPGKEIIRLKNKFGERQKLKAAKKVQFAEDQKKQNPIKQNKKKNQKKLMFEKILNIYEKDYQDTTNQNSENSQKKNRRFVRH